MHKVSFIALAAFATIFGSGVGIGFYKSVKAATTSLVPEYNLVAEYHGDKFILDHDLSLTDCLDAAPRHDPAHQFYTACELMP